METFNDRFEKLISKHGLTKVKMAELLDISVSAISAWASKGSCPNADTFMKIAIMFHVDPEWLVFGSFSKNQSLNSRLNELNSEQLETVEAVITTFERQNLKNKLNK